MRVLAVSDIHGYQSELHKVLEFADIFEGNYSWYLNLKKDVKIIFCGDYVDRGERPYETLTYITNLSINNPGQVEILIGNHDWKLLRWAKGNKVILTDELKATINQLYSRIKNWDNVRLFVTRFYENAKFTHTEEINGINHIFVHAQYAGERKEKTMRDLALYGMIDNERYLPDGRPNRITWWNDYDGRYGTIVFGHYQEPGNYKHAIGLDGGIFNEKHGWLNVKDITNNITYRINQEGEKERFESRLS